MSEKKNIATGYIGNALRSSAADHTTTFADEIFDTERQKYQSEVNTDIKERIKAEAEANTLAISNEAQARAKADEQLNTAIEAEKNRAMAAEEKIIFDVSSHNNGAVFESLQSLLSSPNLNTLIPVSVRCGGMTIRFVQSSDNKYVQYRLMAQNFTTDVTQWQGVDDKPTLGSDNLVKSGGVADKISELEKKISAIKIEAELHLGYIDKATGEVKAISSGYYYSTPFVVSKNDILKITCLANTQAIFTLFNSTDITIGSIGTVLCPSIGSDVRTYEITCQSDGYVAISLQGTDYELSILKDGALKPRVEKIEQDITTLKEKDEQLTVATQAFNVGKIIPSIISNEYLDRDSGDIIQYNGWDRTEYINVAFFKEIGITASETEVGNINYNVWYREDKTFLGNFPIVDGDNILSVPEDAVYMRLSGPRKEISTFSISIKSYKKIKSETPDDSIVAISNKVVNAIDGSCVVFTHMTDSHAGRGSIMPPSLMKEHLKKAFEVAENVSADFLVHTGDIIQGQDETLTATARECYSAIVPELNKHSIPFVWSHGNDEHDRGEIINGDFAMTWDEVDSCVGRSGRTAQVNAVYNNVDTIKRSYYYFDDNFKRCRYIVIDSEDYGDNRKGNGFSTIQVDWFKNTLTDALNKQLPIIIFTHQPPTAMLKDEGASMFDNGLITAMGNFTKAGGKILAYIHGHQHWDNYYYDAVNKIPYICLINGYPQKDNSAVPWEGMWGNPTTPSRSKDDITQYAMDVYVVNVDTKKIHIFRYGAGEDRVIEP